MSGRLINGIQGGSIRGHHTVIKVRNILGPFIDPLGIVRLANSSSRSATHGQPIPLIVGIGSREELGTGARPAGILVALSGGTCVGEDGSVGTAGSAVSVAVVGGSAGIFGALVVVAAHVMAQFVSKGIMPSSTRILGDRELITSTGIAVLTIPTEPRNATPGPRRNQRNHIGANIGPHLMNVIEQAILIIHILRLILYVKWCNDGLMLDDPTSAVYPLVSS